MRYNQLGKTGLFVSEICLGTMTFGAAGENGQSGAASQASARTASTRSSAGRSPPASISSTRLTSIPSASRRNCSASRSGTSASSREDVILATKVHGTMGEGPNQRGSSRGHIMDSVEGSLKRLQTDHIDLYQLHGTDTVTPIEETLRALDDLVSSGKVRYVGVSNWQAWRIAKALGISERKGYARFETIQSYYSIAGRDLEREIVPLINEEKLGLMVWSPMAGGLLSGKYGPGAPGNGEGRRANFNFPPVNEDRAWAAVAEMRKIASEARRQRRHRGAGLRAGQTLRDERDHRRQRHGAAGAEPRLGRGEARRRRSRQARRGERAALRISGLDAGTARRGTAARAFRAEELDGSTIFRRSVRMSGVRPDIFRQEIEEGTHPRRQVLALADIDGVGGFLVARIELLQQRHQPAGGDVGPDMPARQPGDACA